MSNATLAKMQNSARRARRRRRVVCISQIFRGVAVAASLAGCASQASKMANLSIPLEPAALTSRPASSPTLIASHESAPANADAMVAKARAMAFSDPTEKQTNNQIDIAMLAMPSTPPATHRLEGTSAADVTSQTIPHEEVMARLEALSRHPAPGSLPSATSDNSQDTEAAPPVPAHPVSPTEVLRRMRELSGAAPASGGTPSETASAGPTPFGGLAPLHPAPDLKMTPAGRRNVLESQERSVSKPASPVGSSL